MREGTGEKLKRQVEVRVCVCVCVCCVCARECVCVSECVGGRSGVWGGGANLVCVRARVSMLCVCACVLSTGAERQNDVVDGMNS